MAQRLLSKAEFAKLAGVSKPAISKALRGPLAAALDGARIDANHAAARAYLGDKGSGRTPTQSAKRPAKTPRAPTASPPAAQNRRRAPTGPRPKDPPPRIRKELGGLEQIAELPTFADMTMRELAERWGTFRSFADLLAALKTIEEIRQKHLDNEETEGSLISRELVRKSIFGALEETNKRLLADTPRALAGRLLGMGAAGAGVEEAERVVRDLISAQLKLVKNRATRTLREPAAAE